MEKVSDTLIFRYNEDQSVTTLDPAFIKSQSEIWIGTQLYNGLVELDSQLNPVPALALHWDISPDRLVYKFTLRPNVCFHEAESNPDKPSRFLSAHDVTASFMRILNPGTASPAAWIFGDKVLLGDSFSHIAFASESQKPFFAPNDSTFVLRLKRPFPALLSLLGTVNCSIIPAEDCALPVSALRKKPRGTGPFYLKLWEEDVKLILRRNTLYFEKENGQQLPMLEAVNVDFIRNKQTAFMRFISGEYDFFNGMEPGFKDELLSPDGNLRPKYQSRIRMISRPFLNTEYLGFWLGDSVNNAPNPLRDVHLRRALNLAIDRPALIRYLRNGVGVPGLSGFTPPVLFGEAAGFGYKHNLNLAAQELNRAGYPGGRNLPELTLTTTADYLDLVIFIRKNWEELGVKCKVEVQPGGMIRQLRNQGKLQIYRGSWIADYPDPENYLSCFATSNFSPNGPNYTHYSSTAFDRILQQSYLLSGQHRLKELQQADSLMMSDAPIAILYYDKSIRLFHPWVQGLQNDAINRLILKRVRKTGH
ncbi:MAG: ABC transporter substrate-binding protein [Bacteroidetes bacterium]|nr:ABC transporter substrate-binding protein [Bacteroidota bacterium]